MKEIVKNLNTIKENIKQIQNKFNPKKITYKILDEIIKKDYEISDMIHALSTIKEKNKLPEDLKIKYDSVIKDLKELEKEQLQKKEEERKNLEKKMQEANTKELKDIINNIEKDLKLSKMNQKKEQIEKEEQKNNKPQEQEEKKKSKTKLLVTILILTLLIAISIFYLY